MKQKNQTSLLKYSDDASVERQWHCWGSRFTTDRQKDQTMGKVTYVVRGNKYILCSTAHQQAVTGDKPRDARQAARDFCTDPLFADDTLFQRLGTDTNHVLYYSLQTKQLCIINSNPHVESS